MSAPLTDMTCLLVTGGLDVGGVEAVVELLAHELPARGVATTVVCSGAGRTADLLRRDGVAVVVADGPSRMASVLDEMSPDVVEIHNAPGYMVEMVQARGIPYVVVVHNTEINRSRRDWVAVAAITQGAAATIAVSEGVLRHHVAHLPMRAAPRSMVVPNGAPPSSTTRLPRRADARACLNSRLGADLSKASLFVSLARFDAQKNVPGLVAAFLLAAEANERLHLIVAGGVSDWLEYRRADALRRSHPLGDRVHLMGHSDASTMLAAADAFILDSFFEGWPVAATEAAAVGLPLILPDVGGASELLEEADVRGILVPNAAGNTETLNQSAVRRARRRVCRQGNTFAVRDAILDTVQAISVNESQSFEPTLGRSGYGEMVDGHTAALRTARQRPFRREFG